MVRLDVIKQALKQIDGPTGVEVIDRAKGKYDYPTTIKQLLKTLKYRYG